MNRWSAARKVFSQPLFWLGVACQHGVGGAQQNHWLCATCTRAFLEHEEVERRDAEARAQQAEYERTRADEERKRQEAERQRQYAEWCAKVRKTEYLRAVNPEEFEHLVCRLFNRMGYDTTPTPYTGDGGVDGILQKDGQRTLLQCKRVKGSVGEPVLRDLWGTIHHEKADGGIVVTTGTVSLRAREWIKGKSIKVIELEELQQLIERFFTESEVVPADFVVSSSALRLCPNCGKALRLVKGRRGRFYGCSGYPLCHYSKPLR